MSAYPTRTLWVPRAGLVSGLGLLCFGMVLSGCASSQTRTSYYQPVQPPSRLAGAPPVEVEADGREAQLPPPQRTRAEPDDPTQPWSPNYGARAPRKVGEAPWIMGPPRLQPRMAAAN